MIKYFFIGVIILISAIVQYSEANLVSKLRLFKFINNGASLSTFDYI